LEGPESHRRDDTPAVSILSLLADVSAPTHFTWGEHDPFGGPETARQLVDLLPNASLEIVPAAGHAPWLDELDRCAASVRLHLTG